MSGVRPVVRCTLAVLAAWLVCLELNNTVLPGIPDWLGGKFASQLVLLCASALMLLRALWGERAERAAWGLLGLGMLLWTGGDLYWTVVLYDLEEIPIPSLADAGYLLFLPCVFAGLGLLARRRLREASRALWLDGIVGGLAAAAVSAAVVVGPVADAASGGAAAEVAVNLAYPIGDLALLVIVVTAVALGGWRLDTTWLLLGLGVAAFWVADSLYLVTNANGTYASGSWFDAGWNAAAVLFAVAAWRPAREAAAEAARPGTRHIAIPVSFALVSLALLVVGGVRGGNALAAVLAGLSLLAVLARLGDAVRLNRDLLEQTQREAHTDALTGLGNRRRLTIDLEAALAEARPDAAAVLALFDLDGFKHYNDTFGHPAGDALLTRVGTALAEVVGKRGWAYRLGGDEFCLLVLPSAGDPDAVIAEAAAALGERGDGFAITCSWGTVELPREAATPPAALRVADQRMYAQKHNTRSSAGRQSTDVLLRALAERSPGMQDHTAQVAFLAEAVARRMGLPDDEVDAVRLAAELHDVGKVAIPDAILEKPEALDETEWTFMRRHTLIGERILTAAPALGRVGQMVRASHEHFDGSGYPDGLVGEAIPLGARIVAVCDAFDAMTADRPYRDARPAGLALAELRTCAGAQFDPRVVEVFALVWAELANDLSARAA